jgi:hypothetical protein
LSRGRLFVVRSLSTVTPNDTGRNQAEQNNQHNSATTATMVCEESKNIASDKDYQNMNKRMGEDIGRKGEVKGHLEEGGEEEEKKEGTPRRLHTGVSKVQTNIGPNNPIESKEADPPKQADLPEFLQGVYYAEESAFLEDLEKNGFRDLHLVLNKDGYAVWREMPGDAHNDAVELIDRRFQSWKKQQARRINCAVEKVLEPNVRITRSYSPKRKGSGERHPDFAIFGPERLNRFGTPTNGGDLKLPMNPHVIVQFEWANEDDYEEYAIDDMMNYAGVNKYSGLVRPNVAYLIKTVWKGKRGASPVTGFNIYQVRQDERRTDVTPTEYRVGGNEEGENSQISISAEDMGVPVSDEGGAIDPFTIDVHEIRQMLEELERGVFEAAEETS